jgi:hypothetical protein
MSVDQYRKAEGAGDIKQGELGAANRETFTPTFPEMEGVGVTSSESSIGRETYHRTTSKEYDRVGTAPGAPAGTGAGGAAGGGRQESSTLVTHTAEGDQRGGDTSVSGVEAILKVEDDLRKDRENKEALVDALLVQEILSSVIHYFSSSTLLSKPS